MDLNARGSRCFFRRQQANFITARPAGSNATTSAMVAIVAYLFLRSRTGTASPVKDISFMQLTDQAGPKSFPSLSPDGRSFVYTAHASGNWDIYLQRVGGKNPINLTKDSSADDTQPAFSPDGDQIAFRSERNGGGIFVMGATGESVRRLADFGYNPAWSPDSRKIVFGASQAEDPAIRLASDSQLWVVNPSSGEKRQLTNPNPVPDAVQPNWSPHGHRIAYWAAHGGAARHLDRVCRRRASNGGDPGRCSRLEPRLVARRQIPIFRERSRRQHERGAALR
jgi:eukaryotic-like serine/threonine-protein kinase